MKKIFLLFLFISAFRFNSAAQVLNNLVVFCNDPEPFTLILNGVLQNQTPATNVRVEGLTLKVYQVRIIFKSGKKKDHSTTLTFFSTNTECVFALNPHGKKKYTMDYLSSKPIVPVPQNTQTETTNTNNTTTTTNNTPANNTSTQGNNNNTTYQPQKLNLVPIGSNEFSILKNAIGLLDAENKKINVMETLEKSAMNTQQLNEILGLIDNEESKLQLAKKAYLSVTDPQNFTSVLNSFTNTDDKQALQNFISSVGK